MKWIDALKKWNQEKNSGKWCVPRKGSTGYDEVKKIMGGTATSAGLTEGRIKTLALFQYKKEQLPKLQRDYPSLSEKKITEIYGKMFKTLTPTEIRELASKWKK